MDLNKAMVEMYKRKTNGHSKRPKVENGTELNTEEGTAHFHVPETSFLNLHGCETVKQKIILHMNRFARSISGFDDRAKLPLLVCGSDGIGKTSIVEAAANYANLKLIPILLKKSLTQSRVEFKITVAQMEAHIRQNQPAIILIDDLHKINEKEELKFIVIDLLERLLNDETLQLVIFCTSLNSTTTCGIKFLKTFQLERPDLEARRRILELFCNKSPGLKNFSQDSLAALAIDTPSFTPYDLYQMLDISKAESIDGFPTLVDCKQSIEEVKQSFKKDTHLIGQKPSITWDDIGGLPEVREEFKEILEQVRNGNLNCKYAGIALYGPPGCGKTMVAQAMANEAGLNFIAIKPCELVDKFLGETERNIRLVFSEAREFEPCMIFFDEFDGLCGTRGNKDNMTGAINTLLSEMDGFTRRGKSIVLVSTNRIEDIDPAMMRSGRLSQHIYVGPPDEASRREILHVITKKPSILLGSDVNLHEWAKRTKNFTGAKLDHLVTLAYHKAQFKDIENSNRDKPKLLTLKDFECAFEKIQSMKKNKCKKRKMIIK